MEWVLLAMGALVVSMGVFIVRNRDDLAQWQAREVRRRNGWNAETAARNTTPRAMIVIGACAMVIGVIFIGVMLLVVLGLWQVGGSALTASKLR